MYRVYILNLFDSANLSIVSKSSIKCGRLQEIAHCSRNVGAIRVSPLSCSRYPIGNSSDGLLLWENQLLWVSCFTRRCTLFVVFIDYFFKRFTDISAVLYSFLSICKYPGSEWRLLSLSYIPTDARHGDFTHVYFIHSASLIECLSPESRTL